MSRDAQPIDAPPRGSARVEPRTSAIRIRIGGVWRAGHIQRWSRLPDGSWAVWLAWQPEPEHPTLPWRWGWYAYDPETIKPA